MQDNRYRILVIRLSSLGDIILTTPVLDALKENYGNSEISLLTKQKYQGLFESDPRISSVIYFEPEDKDKGVFGLFRLIKSLNQEKFDLIVDLHSNLRSFFIRLLVKAERKVHHYKKLIPRFLMVRFKRWGVNPVSTIDNYLKSLGEIGIKAWSRIPRLYSKNENKIWAENFFIENGLGKKEILIGIAPGARWETKRWGLDKFSSVAKNLSQDLPVKILLVGDKDDLKPIEGIENYVGKERTIQAVDLPLDRLIALVKRCGLFISNDSGLMHLASSLGVPTIGIFGPTSPGLGFSPSGLKDKVFWAGVDCSPCSLHGEKECVKESRYCMDNIKPEKIIEEAKRVLSANKVIFLDRDGTITEEKDFVSKIEEIKFIPGSKEALKTLQGFGYKLVIVSNQSGIARGIMTGEQVEEVNDFILKELQNEGIKIEGIYYCPHHPDENCDCRKPRTGLIKRALQDHHLKLKGAWMIGDKLSDVLFGKNIKGKSILVLTGYGQSTKQKIESNADVYDWHKPDYLAKDLLEAASFIKSEALTESTEPVTNSHKKL
ncbi:MAG: HAD-IIIA family hydrolase [candidate division Zixibacteria bacterium]|nr:HAD-IIIA family hydrolase [candidate division Zixibacteria bacterium]